MTEKQVFFPKATLIRQEELSIAAAISLSDLEEAIRRWKEDPPETEYKNLLNAEAE